MSRRAVQATHTTCCDHVMFQRRVKNARPVRASGTAHGSTLAPSDWGCGRASGRCPRLRLRVTHRCSLLDTKPVLLVVLQAGERQRRPVGAGAVGAPSAKLLRRHRSSRCKVTSGAELLGMNSVQETGTSRVGVSGVSVRLRATKQIKPARMTRQRRPSFKD